MNSEYEQEITSLLKSGQKIQAIKRVREEEHIGLKEAKERIEEFESVLEAHDPNYVASKNKGGCGAAALVLLVPGVLITLAVAYLS